MPSVSEYRTVRARTPISCQRATPNSVARYDRSVRFVRCGADAVVAESGTIPASPG